MDWVVHGVAKSQTQLSNFQFHFQAEEKKKSNIEQHATEHHSTSWRCLLDWQEMKLFWFQEEEKTEELHF